MCLAGRVMLGELRSENLATGEADATGITVPLLDEEKAKCLAECDLLVT